MLYKCSQCEYMSTLNSNVKRHYVRKHENAEKMDEEKTQKVVIGTQKVAKKTQKVVIGTQKVVNDAHVFISNDECCEENIENEHQCIKCEKIFSRNWTLKRHESTCTGNKNICTICNQVLKDKHSKYYHKNNCTGNAVIDQSQTAEIINNNTTNNNITNNTNNITNNNIINNIIVYNDQNIEFKDDHITKKDLKRIFNGASVETIQAISQYAIKLLENIDNLCVRKKHLTNSYCEVYAGNGIWQTRPDQAVFERFSQDVAISANDKLYEHPNIGTDKVRNEITELVSEPDDVHSQSIKLRRELRSIVLHKTKQEQPIEI